jgi:hypothetical protein
MSLHGVSQQSTASQARRARAATGRQTDYNRIP